MSQEILQQRDGTENPACPPDEEFLYYFGEWPRQSPTMPLLQSTTVQEDQQLSLQQLFDERDEGDVTFLCSDKVPVKAHSIVLCSRSEYFNAMCNGWSKEAKTKQIPAEESSIMILRMLKHFYMLSYNDKPTEMHEQGLKSVHVNIQMYMIGEKYLLETLKTEALQKFKTCLEKHDQFDKFIEVVPLIYSNTPTSDQGLRLVAQEYGARNWDQLSTLEDFEDIIAETPAWAIGIISMIRQGMKKTQLIANVDTQIAPPEV